MATKDFPVRSPRVSINPKGYRFIDHKMYARLFIFFFFILFGLFFATFITFFYDRVAGFAVIRLYVV